MLFSQGASRRYVTQTRGGGLEGAIRGGEAFRSEVALSNAKDQATAGRIFHCI